MNRHYREGFQTTFLNDHYHIEERLQDYDPYLYIMWNPTTNHHLIMDSVTETAVMRIPQVGFEYLDSRVVEHIKRIHTANGFSATKQIQEWEANRERENEKRMEDLTYNLAKDIQKPVADLAYGA